MMSHSRIDTLSGCGEKARLKYDLEVPELPSIALVGGKAFHAWAEDWVLYGLDGVEEPAPWWGYFESELMRAEGDAELNRSHFKVTGSRTKALPDGETEQVWREDLGPRMVNSFKGVRLGPVHCRHRSATRPRR